MLEGKRAFVKIAVVFQLYYKYFRAILNTWASKAS